jgi:hypothetical protein
VAARHGSGYRYRGFQRQPYQRSPDRAKSKQRRQMLAATSPLPPQLAARLTPSQQAYARLLADEQLRAGDCRLCLDEIAARIGTCAKTIQRAQQRLKELGYVEVEHRPNEGQKHDTNVVRIISPEWLTWIAMGKIPKRIGGQRCLSTANTLFLKNLIAQLERIRRDNQDENVLIQIVALQERRAAVDRPVEEDPALAAALMRLKSAMRSSA